MHRLTVKFFMTHPRVKGEVRITRVFTGIDKVDCNRKAADYIGEHLTSAGYMIHYHTRKDETYEENE